MTILPRTDPAGHARRATTTPSHPPAHGDSIFRDALIDARGYSTDALLAMAEVFALDAVDDDPDWPGPTGRHLASERLRAIRAELDRRERLARLDAGLPTPSDERFAAWVELARMVRDRVDIVEVFVQNGYQLHDTGPTEAHASCLICGGTDRLVIRRDPPGRCWCRQCGWSGDVLTVAMSLRQCGFRDAVKELATLVGAREEIPA